jgi:hypothetical protein
MSSTLGTFTPLPNAQAPAATHGAVTVDPALGDVCTVTSDGGAISGITLSAGSPGQHLLLVMVQDGGGTGTWPTSFINAVIAGGTITKTATASAVDSIAFRYDGSNWIEVGRALALA